MDIWLVRAGFYDEYEQKFIHENRVTAPQKLLEFGDGNNWSGKSG